MRGSTIKRSLHYTRQRRLKSVKVYGWLLLMKELLRSRGESQTQNRPASMATSIVASFTKLVNSRSGGNQKELAQIRAKGVSSWICTNSSKSPRRQRFGPVSVGLCLGRISTARCVKRVTCMPPAVDTAVAGVGNGFPFFPTPGLPT